MRRPRDQDTILRIARMRYEQRLPQQEIARRLKVSTSTISRALKQAEDLGFIEIRVIPPSDRRPELERALERRFSLASAVVVDTADTPAATRDLLGRATADHLMMLLEPGLIIGVSDGLTTAAVATHLHMPHQPDIEVVPLIGGVGLAEEPAHPNEVARAFAIRLGGRVRHLPVPAIVDSALAATALLNTPIVRSAIDTMYRCGIAVVGVGAISPDAAIVRHGVISADDIARAGSLGSVGSICSRFYDADGAAVQFDLDDRILAIGLEPLRAVAYRLAVAIGPEKLAAIRGALHGEIVNAIATDSDNAAALLADGEAA